MAARCSLSMDGCMDVCVLGSLPSVARRRASPSLFYGILLLEVGASAVSNG